VNFPEYTLLRSSRRTLALEITADAKLLIRAPQWARVHTIEHLLVEKEAWIRKRLSEANARLQKAPKTTLESGDTILFLGEKKSVFFIAGTQKPFLEKGMVFLGEENNLKLVLEQWYRAQAKTILPEKITHYANEIGKTPRPFRITGAEKRWGSCSSSGYLNFSWRLLMAPEWVIDYVVAHETAHILEMNHSPRFWKQLEKLFPNFREAKRWLKEHGNLLRW